MTNLPEFWRSGFGKPFDRLFEEVGVTPYKQGFSPNCEISEDKEGYALRMDLPGIPKEAIKIDLHENCLSISGERKETKKENKKQHFSEVYYGSFTRSFTFPTTIDPELVKAQYEHGILEISVPKAQSSKARQITIK